MRSLPQPQSFTMATPGWQATLETLALTDEEKDDAQILIAGRLQAEERTNFVSGPSERAVARVRKLLESEKQGMIPSS